MVRPHHRSERMAAQATAWLARLESTGRTEATEAGLKAWLVSNDEHPRIFEQAMDAWAIIPGAAETLGSSAVSQATALRKRPLPRFVRPLALAASLLIVGLMSSWWFIEQPTGYSTVLGEQKIATLEDGTRIALNADTQLSVRYDPKTRNVHLDNGEAMFEVAHNAKRPFIVEAGDKTITALGTSFIVRKVGDAVVVTLISGKVRVDERPAAKAQTTGMSTILTPGERLTALPDSPEIVSRTSSEAATAWRRGQVVFDDTSLSAAVAEFNRYGGQHIDVADPRLGGLAVSGVFATNDAADFAAAVAALHGLRVEQEGQRLRISH